MERETVARLARRSGRSIATAMADDRYTYRNSDGGW
jgi:hypothetical protein